MTVAVETANSAAHSAVAWWEVDYGFPGTRDIVVAALDAAEPHIQIAELLDLLERARSNPDIPVAILVDERISELRGRVQGCHAN